MSNEIVEKFAAIYRDNGRYVEFTHDDYKIIETGAWEQDMKVQLREVIVQFEGVYIRLWESRSGSYFSDYEDLGTTIQAVEREEVPVIQVNWNGIGDSIEIEGSY